MEPIEFVESSVSREIAAAVNQGVELKENVLITGHPGVGKSHALAWLYDGSGDCPSRVFTVDGAVGNNSTYLIQQLCESYGVPAGQSRASALHRFIRHGREYFYGERQVVVFDEAQNMKLETVKDIANLSVDHKLNLTVVFCANADIIKISRSAPAALLQAGRRIKVRKTIDSLEPGDTDAFAAAFGVDDAEVVHMARAIGRHFYIDGIVTVLRNAHRLAAGKPIRAQHVRDVIADYFPQYQSALIPAADRRSVA